MNIKIEESGMLTALGLLATYSAISIYFGEAAAFFVMIFLVPVCLLSFVLYIMSNRPYVVKAEYKNDIMSLEYSNGAVLKYKGSGTVWYCLPYLKRCSTATESYLSEYYTYIQYWGNTYPNAHKEQTENSNKTLKLEL